MLCMSIPTIRSSGLIPAAAKDAANDDPHSPAWLAREWVCHRRGTKGRDELDRARETFQEMIRLGCNAAQIAAEITRKERRKTETIWDFEKRVGRQTGVYGDASKPAQFSGIKAWAEKEGLVNDQG